MADRAHHVLTELFVLRAQGGYDDAIGLLVRAWQDRLLRHARRLTGRDDAGRDVMQEAWLDIARGLRTLDDPASFGPWAYRIVARRSAKWIGKEQRRRQVERKAAVEHLATCGVPAATSAVETADAVRVALRQLTVDQQAILELRYVEDFSIEQIAEVLGIAAGTVKSRLFHARQQLRDLITQVTQ
jgi:RNA polymerase sigma-70 factor (ECF subfamily)